MHINNFYTYSRYKHLYCTHDREPFFDIALKYARAVKKDKPVIADIGSGEGDLFHYIKAQGFPAEGVYLLDSNEKTVEGNKNLTPHSILYSAPGKLPFEDGSVDLVHTSHMIEYLAPGAIYSLMVEMDRVLADEGYLVISAPLFWNDFYNDLGHVRPYNPRVFHKYFIEMYKNPRLQKVSDSYEMADLVYRYHQFPLDEGWGSSIPLLDTVIITAKRLLGKLSIKKMYKNGYTLVLKKRGK
jgi:SAM-dependent methyltransferase